MKYLRKILIQIPKWCNLFQYSLWLFVCILAFQRENHSCFGYLIFLGGLFDLDGMIARMLHAYSDLGKSLDSLADGVTFGWRLPSFYCNYRLLRYINFLAFQWKPLVYPYQSLYFHHFYRRFSAIRLANLIDPRQSLLLSVCQLRANAF